MVVSKKSATFPPFPNKIQVEAGNPGGGWKSRWRLEIQVENNEAILEPLEL